MKRESVNRSGYKYIKYDTVKLHRCMMIHQNLPEPTAGIAGTAGSFTLADAKDVAEEELSTGIDVDLTAVAVASLVGDTFDTSVDAKVDMDAPVAVIVA